MVAVPYSNHSSGVLRSSIRTSVDGSVEEDKVKTNKSDLDKTKLSAGLNLEEVSVRPSVRKLLSSLEESAQPSLTISPVLAGVTSVKIPLCTTSDLLGDYRIATSESCIPDRSQLFLPYHQEERKEVSEPLHCISAQSDEECKENETPAIEQYWTEALIKSQDQEVSLINKNLAPSFYKDTFKKLLPLIEQYEYDLTTLTIGTQVDTKEKLFFLYEEAKIKGIYFVLHYIGKSYIERNPNSFSQPNYLKASKCFLLAAELFGKQESFEQLASLYQSGGYGLVQSFVIAVQWWKKAAALSGGSGYSQQMLAQGHDCGWGKLDKNHQKALDYYVDAFHLNKNANDIAYRIGTIYLKGLKPVKQDFVKAFQWLSHAALIQSPRSNRCAGLTFYQLGICYYNGLGTKENYELAVHCFNRAVKKGCIDAWAWLGGMRIRGEGLKSDTKQGLQWLHYGASLGSTNSAFKLARYYHLGEKGVPCNLQVAFIFYTQAAKQGNQEAQSYVRDLASSVEILNRNVVQTAIPPNRLDGV